MKTIECLDAWTQMDAAGAVLRLIAVAHNQRIIAMTDHDLNLKVAEAMGYPIVSVGGRSWHSELQDSRQQLPCIATLPAGDTVRIDSWGRHGMANFYPAEDLVLAMQCAAKFCNDSEFDYTLSYDSASHEYTATIENTDRVQRTAAFMSPSDFPREICKAIIATHEATTEKIDELTEIKRECIAHLDATYEVVAIERLVEVARLGLRHLDAYNQWRTKLAAALKPFENYPTKEPDDDK